MTHTITSPTTTSFAPARPGRRALLVGGIAAGPLFLGAGLVQGLTRDGFDLTRNALSQLSLGTSGWIQVTTFVATGILSIACAAGTRERLRDTTGGTWVPRLIGLFGASFLATAVFPADPGAGFPAGAPDAPATSLSTHGAIHMLSAMVGFIALCAAFSVLARYFATQRRRGWAIASRFVPVGVLAGFAASSVAVLAFTIGAGLGLLWLTAVSIRLFTSAPTARP